MLKLKHQRLVLLERQAELQMLIEEMQLEEQQRKDKGRARAEAAAALPQPHMHVTQVTVPRAARAAGRSKPYL